MLNNKKLGRPVCSINAKIQKGDAFTTALPYIIRERRVNKRLSLKSLADVAGVTIAYMSNVELGRSPLSWDKIPEIAQALEISVGELAHLNLLASKTHQEYRNIINKYEGINYND